MPRKPKVAEPDTPVNVDPDVERRLPPDCKERAYCFTIMKDPMIWLERVVNAMQSVEVGKPWDTRIRYIVFQIEVTPTTNRDHIQGYVEFTGPLRWKGAREALLCDTVHLKGRLGTRDQARHYCMKPNTTDCVAKADRARGGCKHCRGSGLRKPGTQFFEFGDWTSGGQGAGGGKKSALDRCIEMIQEGRSLADIGIEEPRASLIFGDRLTKYQQMYAKKRDGSQGIFCLVLWGRAGVGKSRLANEICKNSGPYYSMPDTERGWMNGYAGEDIIWIEDFSWTMNLGVFKRLIDRYEFRGETKGGFVQVAATKFIITSNHPPERWYGTGLFGADEADKAAIVRRCSTAAEGFLGVTIHVHSYEQGLADVTAAFAALNPKNDPEEVPPS